MLHVHSRWTLAATPSYTSTLEAELYMICKLSLPRPAMTDNIQTTTNASSPGLGARLHTG